MWTCVFLSSLFFLGLEDFSKSVVTVFELCLIPTQQTWRKREVEGNKLWLVVLMKVRDGWWSDHYVKSFSCVFSSKMIWPNSKKIRELAACTKDTSVQKTPASSTALVGPKDFGKITFMQWLFVASTGVKSKIIVCLCTRECFGLWTRWEFDLRK